MGDNHENSTSQVGQETSNGAARLVVRDQDPLTSLLANILGKQQEAQERQMDLLERIARKEGNRLGVGEFQKLNPPAFQGSANPLEAEDWIVAMEKAFEAMGCDDREKVTYATYMLQSSAFEWWDAHKLYPEDTIITWDLFKEAFHKKYFPESVKRMKEKEFIELKQGNRSVGEYEIEFSPLARFAPEFVQAGSSKARGFESGLRQPLKRHVEAFELNTFREVVSKLLEKGYHEERNDSGQPHKKFKFNNTQSMNTKTGKYYGQGKEHPSGNQGSNCPICRGNHYPTMCPFRWGRCFQCGGSGHTRAQCPQLPINNNISVSQAKQRAALPPPTPPLYLPAPTVTATTSKSERVSRPANGQGVGWNNKEKPCGGNRARVYNLTTKDAEEAGKVVTGNILISAHPGLVLFDTGATHSFISANFVRKYQILYSPLHYKKIAYFYRSETVKSS